MGKIRKDKPVKKEEVVDQKDIQKNVAVLSDDISNSIVEMMLDIEAIPARFYILKIVKQKLLMIESAKHDAMMKSISVSRVGGGFMSIGDILNERTGAESSPKPQSPSWVQDLIDSEKGSK